MNLAACNHNFTSKYYTARIHNSAPFNIQNVND